MNNSGRIIAAGVVFFGGLLVGLYVIVSVLTGHGNILGQLYRYFLPVAFIVGALAPRASCYVLIIMGAYIDVLKKAMVAAGDMYFEDVFFILGVPPIMLVGISVAVLLGGVMSGRKFSSTDWKMFFLAAAVVGVFGATGAIRYGFNFSALKGVANNGAYYGLLFIIPVLFSSIPEILKLCRFTIIVMIPAALHGMWHFFVGLFQFEIDYTLSGFTINLKYYYMGELITGPFASQGMLSTVMVVCATLCLIPFFLREHLRGVKFMPKWLCLVLFFFFATACVLSLKRLPYLILFGSVAGFFLFRWRLTTVSIYATAVALVFVLGTWTEEISEWLGETQSNLQSVVESDNAKTMVRLNTFNVRLRSFEVFLDPQYYSPFGLSEEERLALQNSTHTPLTDILLRFGVVGLSFFLLSGGILAFLFHRQLVIRERSLRKELLLYFASVVFAILGISFLGSTSFGVYPLNFFFALFCGFCLRLIHYESRVSSQIPNRVWQPLATRGMRQQQALRPQPGMGRLPTPGAPGR